MGVSESQNRCGDNVKFSIGAYTDIGIKKATNQDALMVKLFDTPKGQMVFAVLCDGMGGLSKGEVAGSSVVRAFEKWFNKKFPMMIENGITDENIKLQWNEIVFEQNERLYRYGESQGIVLGTTIVALLIAEEKYYLMNVGDSRAYAVTNKVTQLSNDHSLIAQEIKEGRLTPEQAKTDKRRSVLLQCIGAGYDVNPEYYFGTVKSDTVYFLCSDGFVHEITNDEMYEKLNHSKMNDKEAITASIKSLIDTDKSRGEKDNISVIAVRAN